MEPKKINDIGMAIAVISHEGVDCFVAQEYEKSQQPDALVSCVGGIFWGREGETWPVSKNGVPLMPWLQIVCTEIKNLYGPFYNKKSICFYLEEEFDEAHASSELDQSDFVVREYSLNEKLVPLKRPEGLENHPFCLLEWHEEMDFPSLSKYEGLLSKEIYKHLIDIPNFEYENEAGIKIGGWPTPVQNDQKYPSEYHLQIDMTENFTYADSGIGYLLKDGDSWELFFETL